MNSLDTLLSMIYEPHHLTAQSSGGLDALVMIAVLWATVVLVAGTYLTRRTSRRQARLAGRVAYWGTTLALATCRVTGIAPLSNPLWLLVSLLGGIYVLDGDFLGSRPCSEVGNTIPPPTDTRLRRGAFVLLVITLAWSAVEYLRHRTSGVSGSDPFCYVQMALDLVRHGTFAHRFPLTALAASWGLPPEPALPVGYWLPAGTDAAITSYSFGFPLLLAAGYVLGDEGALWLVTPLLGLAAVMATWALAQALFDDEPRGRRWAIGAVAAWIVATSYTQMRLTIVPMSDVPSQLFSTLALSLALAAERSRRALLSALSGAALGTAYLIRHTSLVLLAPLAVILMRSRPAKRDWWQRQLALGLVAVLVALPDLLYHQRWLGSFWRGENPEIGRQAGLAHVGASLSTFVEYLSYPGEFGWLWPLFFVGAYVLWRQRRTSFVVLIAWFLALATVHLPVHTTALFQNGARYLLPAFPAPALIVGAGAVHLVDGLISRSYATLPRRASLTTKRATFSAGRDLRHAGPVFVMVLALTAPFVLRTPLHKPLLTQYPTFGHLSSSQQAEFAALRATIPEEAVIACG
ncbi:MAG: glycosyltransferase family 39 protein, partial [Chloroflexota bacterium]|nr:glycosyltransferase family 39 protein [Chloroflexota bacterium]